MLVCWFMCLSQKVVDVHEIFGRGGFWDKKTSIRYRNIISSLRISSI